MKYLRAHVIRFSHLTSENLSPQQTCNGYKRLQALGNFLRWNRRGQRKGRNLGMHVRSRSEPPIAGSCSALAPESGFTVCCKLQHTGFLVSERDPSGSSRLLSGLRNRVLNGSCSPKGLLGVSAHFVHNRIPGGGIRQTYDARA